MYKLKLLDCEKNVIEDLEIENSINIGKVVFVKSDAKDKIELCNSIKSLYDDGVLPNKDCEGFVFINKDTEFLKVEEVN